MKTQPEENTNLVNHGFMDARAKLLDIAAFFDRIERADQENDYRVRALKDAIGLLDQPGGQRAREILLALSDPTEETIPVAHTKGAAGAWEGTEA
ncbi:MAG: hypothetical protein AAF492_03675 [Verrucomicrobiota bacterium]